MYFRNEDKILVSEGYDYVKDETFFRPLGGGIEFGEKSNDALKREMIEELGAGIKNLQYLAAIENIFVCEGNPGHEIIQIFDGEFKDKEFYNRTLLDVLDMSGAKVFWKKNSDFGDKKDILYPVGLLDLLQKQVLKPTFGL